MRSAWVAVAAGVALAVWLAAPRAAPGVAALLAISMALASYLATRRLDVGRLTPPLAAAGLFGLYALTSATWTLDRAEGLGKALLLLLFVGLAHLGLRGMLGVPRDTFARIGRACLIVVLAGAVYMAIENMTGQLLRRIFVSLFPSLRPSPKHVIVGEGDWVEMLSISGLNRNVAVLTLALWPVLLMLTVVLKGRQAVLAALGLSCAATLAILTSQHETSMIALALSALVFVAGRLSIKAAAGLVAAGWIVATLLVVPLASWSYSSGLHKASWIPLTGRARIILWGYTAEQIPKAPILGIGVNATRVVDDRIKPTAERPPGYPIALRPGQHSHNIFMQTWYELGAIGALLLLGTGLVLLREIVRGPPAAARYGLAAFTAAAVIAAFSWGLWQAWFLASFAVGGLLMVIATRLATPMDGTRKTQ